MHKSYVVCLHTPAESRWERDKNVASLLFLQTFQCFQNSPDLLSYFRVNKCSVEKGMRNPNALENQTGSFQYKLQRIMLAVPVYFFKFKIFLIFLPEKKKTVSLKGGWSDFQQMFFLSPLPTSGCGGSCVFIYKHTLQDCLDKQTQEVRIGKEEYNIFFLSQDAGSK